MNLKKLLKKNWPHLIPVSLIAGTVLSLSAVLNYESEKKALLNNPQVARAVSLERDIKIGENEDKLKTLRYTPQLYIENLKEYKSLVSQPEVRKTLEQIDSYKFKGLTLGALSSLLAVASSIGVIYETIKFFNWRDKRKKKK